VPEAGPPPVLGQGNEPGSDRVEMNIPRKLKGVNVVLHRGCLVAGGEQMARSFSLLVVPSSICAVQPMHELREVREESLQEEVEVRIQQTVCNEDYGHLLEVLDSVPEISHSVLVVAKDRMTVISPVIDVV
jgi:hypothetical protein